MECKKICGILILLSVVLMSGCQKTPEKEVVVNRSEGLNSNVISDAVSGTEERKLDISEQWSIEEVRGEYDNVITSANLDMEPVYTTNLPVIEMKRHELTERKLVAMVNYFAKEEILYQPKDITVEELQYLEERIGNQEGEYGNPSSVDSNSFKLENIDKLLTTMQEDIIEKSQKAEIKFQKKPESHMYYVVTGESQTESEEEYYFAADIGEGREGSIKATTANEAVGSDSSFSYEHGYMMYEEELNVYRQFEINDDMLLNEYHKALNI